MIRRSSFAFLLLLTLSTHSADAAGQSSNIVHLRFLARVDLAAPIATSPVTASADGRAIATYDEDDRRVFSGPYKRWAHIFDARSGIQLQRFLIPRWDHLKPSDFHLQVVTGNGFRYIPYNLNEEKVIAVALDERDHHLALLTDASIVLLDTTNHKVVWCRTKADALATIAFSANGRDLFTSGRLVRAEERSVIDGRPIWSVRNLGSQPDTTVSAQTLSLAVSADDRYLAVGDERGGVHIYRGADGYLLTTLVDPAGISEGSGSANQSSPVAHAGRVVQLRFSPDSSILASAGGDGTVKLWDPQTRRLLARTVCGRATNALTFAGGKALYAGCGADVIRIDVRTGNIEGRLAGHDDDILALALAANGRLWSFSRDGTAKLWSLREDVPLKTFGSLSNANFSSDGRRLAYSYGDRVVHVTSTSGARSVASFEGFRSPDSSNSFSSLSRTLAVSGNGRTVAAGAYTTIGFIDHQGVYRGVLDRWSFAAPEYRQSWQGVAPEEIDIRHDGRAIIAVSFGYSDTSNKVWLVRGGKVKSADWGLNPFGDGLRICSWEQSEGMQWFPAIPITPYFTSNGVPAIVGVRDLCKHKSLLRRFGIFSALDPHRLLVHFAGAPPTDDAVYAVSPDGRIVTALSKQAFRAWSARHGEELFDVSGTAVEAPAPGHIVVLSNRLAIAAVTMTASTDSHAIGYALRLRSLQDGRLLASTPLVRANGLLGLAIRSDDRVVYVATRDGFDVWSVAEAHPIVAVRLARRKP